MSSAQELFMFNAVFQKAETGHTELSLSGARNNFENKITAPQSCVTTKEDIDICSFFAGDGKEDGSSQQAATEGEQQIHFRRLRVNFHGAWKTGKPFFVDALVR